MSYRYCFSSVTLKARPVDCHIRPPTGPSSHARGHHMHHMSTRGGGSVTRRTRRPGSNAHHIPHFNSHSKASLWAAAYMCLHQGISLSAQVYCAPSSSAILLMTSSVPSLVVPFSSFFLRITLHFPRRLVAGSWLRILILVPVPRRCTSTVLVRLYSTAPYSS